MKEPLHTPGEQGLPLAFEGLRVIDFSRVLAGPFGTQMLADIGADVIKVENPRGGDDARASMPHIGTESVFLLAYNRNKRSIAIDFTKPEGNIETKFQNMSLAPADDPVAAPLLGQHTRAILQNELGYTPEKIAMLAESGVIDLNDIPEADMRGKYDEQTRRRSADPRPNGQPGPLRPALGGASVRGRASPMVRCHGGPQPGLS